MTGWSITSDPKTKQMVYDIKFSRLASEPSMKQVLRRPYVEEVEDYREYKRLRQVHRDRSGGENKPTIAITGDGVFEDATAESPFQRQFTDKLPEDTLSAAPLGRRTVLCEASGSN